ncbi:MAG: thiamine pyrophosphate-requiring protein [Chloroflexota bacterium]
MTGHDLMAKILKAEGVEHIFAFPMQSLIDTGAKIGITPIICRQERAGVNMADGLSRVTNGKKLGVFTMQQGPGAENAFGGVAQSYADSVPILHLPGGEPLSKQGIKPTFSAVPNYLHITKWAAQIHSIEDIPAMVRRAIIQMKSGHMGPVLLEMPSDLFRGEAPDLPYTPVTIRKSMAATDDVKDLVTALLKAKNPVICAGHGVLWAEATADLIEFAELTKIPVMTSMAGKSAFPENHPLALGAGGLTRPLMVTRFLENADFVLGIGTSFTRNTFTTPMPDDVIIGMVTNCAEDIGKDYEAQYGAVGDAQLVLRQMIEEVKSQTSADGREDTTGVADRVAAVTREFETMWEPHFTTDETPISPYRVLRELYNGVDVANTIITHDSGYPRDQFVPMWKTLSPRGYLSWGKSTQLGFGLGLAIGAKIGAPDKQVINVMGDAAFGMAGLDLETSVRANAPILTVVLNNGVMTKYDSHMPNATERYDSNQLAGNYAAIGAALGAHAERVDNPADLPAAIKRATDANKDGQAALLEVMTKAEPNVSR